MLDPTSGCIKIDENDFSIKEGCKSDEICISVCFEELPDKVVIDATNETTLENEYLLNKDKQLEIVKKYFSPKNKKVFLRAYHPANPECSDLLLKKDSELREILKSYNIECKDKTRNAIMRKDIWKHFENNLQLAITEIDVSKNDVKNIWDKLEKYLPLYSLFQSDRKNTDSDAEVQDPLKVAVKEILADNTLMGKLNSVAEEVDNKLKSVLFSTLEKLKEISPDVAKSLTPVIPPLTNLKWADVFKTVSITGDGDIPINKRGSGFKRLVLLSFFRAEVERRKDGRDLPNVIYAIEEPETSQHTENQKKLIHSLVELSKKQNTQVIITSHSANIVKKLDFKNLWLISLENGIEKVQPCLLAYRSLNEVNYLAFSEITEEYHNELYGFIESKKWLPCYIDWFPKHYDGKSKLPYIKLSPNGKENPKSDIIRTVYIRNQIHHPENEKNDYRYTDEDLGESIRLMREFIVEKGNNKAGE